MAEDKEPGVLEPLTFSVTPPNDLETAASGASQPTKCLFCEETFDVQEDRDSYVGHLVQEHNLLIADFKFISDFKRLALIF